MSVESVWREIHATWGLLTSDEVLRVLGLAQADSTRVSVMRADGVLLAVKPGDVYVYPGFQFESGQVKPVIADLVDLARDVSWAQDDLAIWLCSPSGYFRGERPVEHLDQPDELLKKARDAATVEW
ncbi:hypothetical protein [Cryobacterium shii]|uniref:DUF2384 domain-containing protein n=1 Tax=Cryobacterium shii TaxID=1259235 RepID=A0AAQ2C6X7_9MICO|nr:hypothetical protein [Cryobacterium shii]TFC48925.1 hypothetical protein E3O49_06865 [Cryobacterium shii]